MHKVFLDNLANTDKLLTTYLNLYSYMLVRKNKKQLGKFNIKIDAGILVLIMQLFGVKLIRESFDMTSLAPVFFNEAIQNDKSIYFIGLNLC